MSDPREDPGIVIVYECELSPEEAARQAASRAAYERNKAWFHEHAPEVGAAHAGKFIAVAGGEPFIADTIQEAVARARAAHPDDHSPFLKYIFGPAQWAEYAHRRLLRQGERLG